jgi:DNA-binding beta-propeller fold protein YncE
MPYPLIVSPGEGPVGGQMASDSSHNLYVVDTFNNRVLRFDDPFTHDNVPDKVWGQTDYTSRECNRGSDAPTADRLCTGNLDTIFSYTYSSGVDVTPDGSTLWVADLNNHRVLRIPTSGTSANLVLGQPDMQTVNANCDPSRPLTSICKPNAVRYDTTTKRLFVIDGEGDKARLMVWNNPTTNGQAASAVWKAPANTSFSWPRGLTLDPTISGAVWINDTANGRLLQYINGTATRVLSKGDFTTMGCVGGLQGDGALYPQACEPHGSLGIDRDGSVYTEDQQEHQVKRFPGPIPLPNAKHIAHSPDITMFDDGAYRPNMIGAAGLEAPVDVLMTPAGLVVTDQYRLMFWTNYATGPLEGGAATGVLGESNFYSWSNNDVNRGETFQGLAFDATRQLLYATHGDWITAWSTQSGLASSAAPASEIQTELPIHGGNGATLYFHSTGIAVDPQLDVAWISDPDRNRILRVINFSQNSREIDLVLGQSDATSAGCNRGAGDNSTPVADGFCKPGQTTFDRLGNLYVVDGSWEQGGNKRALEFDRATLPPVPSPQVFWASNAGPAPTRVFAKKSFSDHDCDGDFVNQPCTPRFLAFEPGTNRMIMTVDACGTNCINGFNPLESRIFIYNNPVPVGVIAPAPSGRVPLPLNQAGGVSFDSAGRLAITDHTWNRVMLVTAPPR